MAFALHFLKILANDPGERDKSFLKKRLGIFCP